MSSASGQHIREYINGLDESFLLFDDLDDALIGIAAVDYLEYPVYSKRKMVKHFMTDGMSFDEALEYVDFNVVCIKVSDALNPIIVDDITF